VGEEATPKVSSGKDWSAVSRYSANAHSAALQVVQEMELGERMACDVCEDHEH